MASSDGNQRSGTGGQEDHRLANAAECRATECALTMEHQTAAWLGNMKVERQAYCRNIPEHHYRGI